MLDLYRQYNLHFGTGFFLLHVAALIMADLVWLNERLASCNEKTEATWELLRTMHH
jgi:hypothetical protein